MTHPELRRGARRAGILVSVSAALLTGLASAASAISHGTDAPSGEAPWMATLAIPGTGPLTERGYCGGTLIAPDRVLTAGHCVLDKSPADFEVYFGADQLSQTHEAPHQVRGWFWHPGWREIDTDDESFAAHDLAVVVLDRPVLDVRPAQFATPAKVAAAVKRGATGQVYGHGRTEHTDPAKGGETDRLQQAAMKLLPPGQCAPDIPQDSVGSSGFCVTGVPAGPADPAPSVCAGDSGGPLMLSTADGPELAGVLSAESGNECDGDAHQGELMNPSDWREEALRPNPELAPTGTLRIAGTPAVGQRLDATVDGLTPRSAAVRYDWYQEKVTDTGFKYFVAVEGATTPALTVSQDLLGKQLKCVATLTTSAGEVRLEALVPQPREFQR
ncbi:serine protease [Amycolatopsis sp. NPDC051373]|uniref:S1 family peptidase n=1 Tax=Amycolatopsis sp. NPDC051373 TaxID=3155801 RepID=UPI00344D71E4